MAENWTKGPWRADKFCVWLGENGDRFVAATERGIDPAEHDANVKLIAAAPELYAALSKITNFLEYLPGMLAAAQMSGHAGNCTILARAGRAALAAARGEG